MSLYELLEEAVAYQRRYEKCKLCVADPGTVSYKAIIPFKALSLREILFHRFVDINSTTIQLMKQDNWIQAFILLRCAIETTALLNQLSDELQKALKTDNINCADVFLIKALAGKSGEKDWETRPANIQSAINKLDSKYNGFKVAHTDLSGYVHPNFDGLFKAYSKWDNKRLLLILGQQNYSKDNSWGLSILNMCFVCFEQIYNELPKYIKAFSILSENKLMEN